MSGWVIALAAGLIIGLVVGYIYGYLPLGSLTRGETLETRDPALKPAPHAVLWSPVGAAKPVGVWPSKTSWLVAGVGDDDMPRWAIGSSETQAWFVYRSVGGLESSAVVFDPTSTIWLMLRNPLAA